MMVVSKKDNKKKRIERLAKLKTKDLVNLLKSQLAKNNE